MMIGTISLAFGQTANDYFHNGAQRYIGSELQQAIAAVQKGLEMEPDNPRLQALLEKLKEQQKQQQQNQQQQNEDQQKQDQQKQQQQNQDDQQDQKKEEEQKQQQQNQDQDQQKKDQQKQQPQPQEGEKKEISKKDAERILQALRSKEKENQKLRAIKLKGKKKVKKDW